jgi:hypothetical protein
MTMTDKELRERWVTVRERRAADLTIQDVIWQDGAWRIVLGVYRDMDEWEAEFGALPNEPEHLTAALAADRQYAADALEWAAPAWTVLRLMDLGASSPGETADELIRLPWYELVRVQDLPSFEPSHAGDALPTPG